MAQNQKLLVARQDEKLIQNKDRFEQGPAKSLEVGGNRSMEKTRRVPLILPKESPANHAENNV